MLLSKDSKKHGDVYYNKDTANPTNVFFCVTLRETGFSLSFQRLVLRVVPISFSHILSILAVAVSRP